MTPANIRQIMGKDISLTADEAMLIMNVLDEVVVSLDRIGSRDAAGSDAHHLNIWEYFTSDGATERLAQARSALASAYDRTYTEDELEAEVHSRPIVYWTDRHPDR